MTEQERINEQFQRQIDAQDARIDKALSNFDTKFNMVMEEIRQQREDMRRLQDRQDEERRKHDAEMKEMNAKIDQTAKEFTKQLHANFIQTMLGVGAIMAAIGGLIIAAVKWFRHKNFKGVLIW